MAANENNIIPGMAGQQLAARQYKTPLIERSCWLNNVAAIASLKRRKSWCWRAWPAGEQQQRRWKDSGCGAVPVLVGWCVNVGGTPGRRDGYIAKSGRCVMAQERQRARPARGWRARM